MSKVLKVGQWWLAVLLWMSVIYYFSSQPDLKSDFQPVWDLIFRKFAHLAEFFVLAFLFFKAYGSLGLSKIKSLVMVLIFAIVYASFDEWHQSQVAGRVASVLDVGVDSLGVLSFIFLKFFSKK